MKIRSEYTCPLELVHDMLKGKWKTIIIWRLRLEATSLSKLRKDINGITEKMLLQHLKDLIKYSLVEKKEYEGYPLKVEYSLTSRGKEVLSALEIFQKIGIEYMIEDGKEEELRKLCLLK
ncbi:helix-turn-helix domain-containing protein [Clostridium carnis]